MPDEDPAALPRPRNVWMPLLAVFCVLLVLVTIVLAANGGRNMATLFKAFDLPLPAFMRAVMPAAPPDTRPVGVARRGWPWFRILTPADRLIDAPLPDAICLSLDANGGEAPSFSRSSDGGWECSALTRVGQGENASSLFLQIRGAADNRFNVVRVKFNLADGALTRQLAQGALGFLNAAMALPPSDPLDDALMQKLVERENFYFLAGYHAVTFRREVDDPDRYNLIGFHRRSAGRMPISDWPKIRPRGEWQIAAVPKGPRRASP